MPHVQPRTKPIRSPADVDGPLEAIQGAGISLAGVSGSDIEWDGGEIGFLVNDADAERLREVLSPWETRIVGEPDGLHLDYVLHEAGGLLAAVRRGRRHHANAPVTDIAVGLDAMTFWVDANDDAIRHTEATAPDELHVGTPVEDEQTARDLDPAARAIDAHPVQIFYVAAAARDENGIAIPGG